MWQAYSDQNREKAEKSLRARDFNEERKVMRTGRVAMKGFNLGCRIFITTAARTQRDGD